MHGCGEKEKGGGGGGQRERERERFDSIICRGELSNCQHLLRFLFFTDTMSTIDSITIMAAMTISSTASPPTTPPMIIPS